MAVMRGAGPSRMFQKIWARGPASSEDTSQSHCEHLGVQGSSEKVLP